MVFNTHHHTRTCLDEKNEIDEKNNKTLEKISVMETIDLEWPEKEFNACLCLVIKNFLKEELKNVDPLNLEKFSNKL